MMMKSFALSRLAQQRMLLGAKFAQRYAHDWLVWEPGAWSVPRGNISVSETVPPKTKGAPPAPAKGDALCFVLLDKVTIGRAEGNDLILSDETVSRNHCVLEKRDGAWFVERHPEAKDLKLDGVHVATSMRLSSGQRIQLGQVVLSYISSSGMVTRLQQPAAPPG